jgi:hypothetical protein
MRARWNSLAGPGRISATCSLLGLALVALSGVARGADVLKPAHTASFRIDQLVGCGDSQRRPNAPARSIGVEVGYTHLEGVCGASSADNAFARGAVFFDVSALSGRAILHATLVLPPRPQRIFVATPDEDERPVGSCVMMVSNGTSAWWNEGGQIVSGSPSLGAVLADEVDVTSIVDAWVRGTGRGGAPNFGFVLQGANEDLTALTGTCMTDYDTPTLVVESR